MARALRDLAWILLVAAGLLAGVVLLEAGGWL